MTKPVPHLGLPSVSPMVPGLAWPGTSPHSCVFLVVGKQLAGSVTKLHSHEITFNRDSIHIGGSSSPPSLPLWVLPFLSWGAPCCKSHRGHPLPSKGLAILSSQCIVHATIVHDEAVKGCRKISARWMHGDRPSCVYISRNIAKYVQPWPTVKAQAVEESKACKCIAYQYGKVTARQGQSRPTTLPWESRK